MDKKLYTEDNRDYEKYWTICKIPEDSWDVSEHQNGSVMAWVERMEGYTSDDGTYHELDDEVCKYNLYIAADGGVNARNCRGLFGVFGEVDTITFNDCFHTDETTDMSFMFADCWSLVDLDVSNFDTSQVTDMSRMFEYCWSLVNLDVSNFDTSQVTDMSGMFADCWSLVDLDISNFDMSNVTEKEDMFSGCNSLPETVKNIE